MRLINEKIEKQGLSEATYLLWETKDHGLAESSILHIEGRSVPIVYCLPSSVGCQMSCTICAMPFTRIPRVLLKDELQSIIEYSLSHSRYSARGKGDFQVSFMGQGEPLIDSINIFQVCRGLISKFPEAMVAISTVGIASGIQMLSNESWSNRVRLQISIHAWPAEKRMKIVPAERFYPVNQAIREAVLFATRWHTKVCLNCVLIEGINDSENDAREIIKLADKGPFYIKISEFNGNKKSRLKPAPDSSVFRFREILEAGGLETHTFKSLGTSIGAGCGQTRIEKELSIKI
jgi:23S rRNA (adenine2503-C2)-methyltransferase